MSYWQPYPRFPLNPRMHWCGLPMLWDYYAGRYYCTTCLEYEAPGDAGPRLNGCGYWE